MEVGDLIILNNSPFQGGSIFGYMNGDLGIIKHALKGDYGHFDIYVVLILRNMKEYHIPHTYMMKLEKQC